MNITFLSSEHYLNVVENSDKPCPAIYTIEDWYKEITHDNLTKKTIKGCMPFLDGMTAGYNLKLPQDFAIALNQTDIQNNCLRHEVNPSFSSNNLDILKYKINLNTGNSNDWHGTIQVTNSPYAEKNGNMPIYKIYNPWIIKTPPGYSCLFIPPIGSKEDRFHIIPAIVDTDNFNLEINFPIVFNTEKYKNSYIGLLKKGTPYVQIIPFKRESWKMKINIFSEKEKRKNTFKFFSSLGFYYKLNAREKKSWK